jgi:hypothetical protein
LDPLIKSHLLYLGPGAEAFSSPSTRQSIGDAVAAIEQRYVGPGRRPAIRPKQRALPIDGWDEARPSTMSSPATGSSGGGGLKDAGAVLCRAACRADATRRRNPSSFGALHRVDPGLERFQSCLQIDALGASSASACRSASSITSARSGNFARSSRASSSGASAVRNAPL